MLQDLGPVVARDGVIPGQGSCPIQQSQCRVWTLLVEQNLKMTKWNGSDYEKELKVVNVYTLDLPPPLVQHNYYINWNCMKW